MPAGSSTDVLVRDFSIQPLMVHGVGADTMGQFCVFASGARGELWLVKSLTHAQGQMGSASSACSPQPGCWQEWRGDGVCFPWATCSAAEVAAEVALTPVTAPLLRWQPRWH